MRETHDGKVFTQRADDAVASDASGGLDAAGTPTRQHARRTVGVTEQRLRAANQQSWMTTRTGWAKLFRRFLPGS